MTDKSHELLEAALDHLHGMNSYEDCLLKNRIRAYLSNTSNDAEEPTKIKIAAEREDIDWQSNEGAVYLFAGWLTTRDTVISCGRTENASPMAEAIKEYKAEWPERFTKLAEPEVKREPLHLPEQDEGPVAWMFFSSKGRPHYHLNEYQALEGLKMYGGSKVIALYEHPAPRKQDDEPVATLDHNGNFELLRMVGVTYGQSINLYALEEKNK